MNEDDLRRIWDSYRTSHHDLHEHYRHIIFDVVERIRPERPPSIPNHLLTIYAHYALDDALELAGTLRDPAEEFEDFARGRMEHFVNDWLDSGTKLSNESGDAEDSTGDYRLTWSMMHERRYTSEVKASEAARSIPGMVILSRPDGTSKIFEAGGEREVVLGETGTPSSGSGRPKQQKRKFWRK